MQLQCGAYGLGLSGLEVSKKVKRNKTHRAPSLTNAARTCKNLNRMQRRSTYIYIVSAPSVAQQVKTQSSNTIQNEKMNMRRICAILNPEMKQTLCISVDEQFEDSDVDYEFLEI